VFARVHELTGRRHHVLWLTYIDVRAYGGICTGGGASKRFHTVPIRFQDDQTHLLRQRPERRSLCSSAACEWVCEHWATLIKSLEYFNSVEEWEPTREDVLGIWRLCVLFFSLYCTLIKMHGRGFNLLDCVATPNVTILVRGSFYKYWKIYIIINKSKLHNWEHIWFLFSWKMFYPLCCTVSWIIFYSLDYLPEFI